MNGNMMERQVSEALEVLRRGGVIIYPTDTVWGIGCDATDMDAVGRIYSLKRSVNKKGMIVLVDSVASVGRYFGRVPQVAWDLLELATTPLTLILPNACGVAPNLIPEEGTMAVRVPDHEFCRRLTSRLGHPLVSTSANISGEPTPMSFADITPEVLGLVDYVVDRSCEGHPTGKASSIMSVMEDGQFRIIR